MAAEHFWKSGPESRQFYHKLLNRVLLNAYAVRVGLFDTVFCETDDPTVFRRWEEKLPEIVQILKIRAQKS